MPTEKPRVIITLEPSRYQVLKAWSDRQGLSPAQVVGALVETVVGLLAVAGGEGRVEQPSLFPGEVVDALREVFPVPEDRETQQRFGGALDALKATGGWTVLVNHLRGVAAVPPPAGEHPAQPPGGGRRPSTEGKSREGLTPGSNTGVTPKASRSGNRPNRPRKRV